MYTNRKFKGMCILLFFIFPLMNIPNVSSSSEDNTIELVLVSETNTGGDTFDVWVDEILNLAYVTSGYEGLRIFDISDPSEPELLSHVPESPALISTGHSSGFAHQIYVYDEIAYIGDGSSGLTIIDCQDPQNPEILTNYVGGYTWDVHVENNLAYIVNGFNNIGNPGFMILNVSDPSNPVQLSNSLTSGDTNGVEIAGNKAYVLKTEGLKILDISNSSEPQLIGQYAGPTGSFAIDVEISGNYAFLTFWNKGLQILDIEDPTDITLIGEYNEFNEFAFLSINDGLVYLAGMTGGIVVLNMTDPNFSVVGSYSDTGKAYGILALEEYVFLADQEEGLKILEITTVSNSENSSVSLQFELFLISLITCFAVMNYKKRL